MKKFKALKLGLISALVFGVANGGSKIKSFWGSDLVATSMAVGKSSTVNSKAVFETVSTTKGSLPAPSMTTTERDNISSPPTGLMIFNATTTKYNTYNGTSWAEIGGGAGGLYAGGQNLITNNSWENDTTNWTASGGSYARVTTAAHIVPPGVGSASWDASASAQTLTANTVTITANDGLSGRNGVMSCSVKTAATDLKMQAYDGTNVLSANATTDVVPSSSAGFVRYSVNFIFPSSGTITGRFYAQSDSAIAYIDDCYLGLADGLNISNVSQAEMYGRIVVSGCTAGPAWVRSNTAYGSFGTSANCSYSASGNASAPSTNLPAIKFASLPPGNYYFVARSNFNKSVTTTNSSIAYEFHDGTTGFGENAFSHSSASGAVISANSINGFKEYTTAQSNITFEIYGKTSNTASTTEATIGDGNGTSNPSITNDLEIEVYRFPLASQTSYKPDQVAWYVDANISGANFDLGTSDQASYVEMTNASMTLTNNSGGATAQIACASGTASTGTTCSVNESNGIAFSIPKAGVYEACTNASHYIDTGVSGAAGVTFQIVETTNTSSAVVQEGKDRPETRNENSAFAPMTFPVKVCGLFTFSSAGQKTLRLEYEQDVTATLTSNLVLADGAAASGQRDIHWTVRPWLNNEPAPLLVNSVLSNSSGIERIERATLTNSGSCAVSSQSGSWIASVSDPGAGQCTINFTAGLWSAAPTCICSGAPNGGNPVSCTISAISSSAVTTLTAVNNSTVGADTPIYIQCMGAK